jgi:hypothetical protein
MSEIRFSFKFEDDIQHCGVCVAFYKAAVITAYGDKIREIEQDGKDGTVWLPEPGRVKLPPVQRPCTVGTSLIAPVLGTTLLCESHAPAISPQVSRLALGQGPLPPGLLPPGLMGRG